MNRFEKGVDYPRSKKIPPWNNRAHVTTSTNNHLYHTHFKEFFDKRSGNYAYVSSYLFPEKHFETYAKLLDVEVSFLKSVGELCDKPDLEKEKLVMEVADLENLKILD